MLAWRLTLVLLDVAEVLWIGCFIGALIKLLSPHRNWVSWIVAALVGGMGAIGGMFLSRIVGIGREEAFRTRMVAAVCAVVATLAYAAVSRLLVRRLARRGRQTRPTIAF